MSTTDDHSPVRQSGHSTSRKSLYVTHLPLTVTEEMLMEDFSRAGPVASVKLIRDRATNQPLGRAFINFMEPVDAQRVVDNQQATQAVRIQWARQRPTASVIIIKNLEPSVDCASLCAILQTFGPIVNCKLVPATYSDGPSTDGPCTGGPSTAGPSMAFVQFSTEESATRSITALHGTIVKGLQLSVEHLKPHRERDLSNNNNNIFIRNLDPSVDAHQLEQLFSRFGPIVRSKVMEDHEGQSRGMGFVHFADRSSADSACSAMNGTDGLFVERARPFQSPAAAPPQLRLWRHDPLANLYVWNLPYEVRDERLLEQFAGCGCVESARVVLDASGKSKGFGFVRFSSPQEAATAVARLNGRWIDGRPWYVDVARPKVGWPAPLEGSAGCLYPPLRYF